MNSYTTQSSLITSLYSIPVAHITCDSVSLLVLFSPRRSSHVKGCNWDDVVYAFNYNGDGVALKNFQGRSTSARLHELELIAKKRPRSATDNGPRKEILRNRRCG